MKDRNGAFKSVLFDVLLIATGKTPNISELNLELAEIDHSVEDGVYVNQFLNTTNFNVYAVGDCVAQSDRLTHNAEE